MWRGGRAISYGPGWKETKVLVRDRDKVCQFCGKTPEQNGRALDVHHIDPYRYTANNHPDNLVALCRSCHMRAIDRGRRGSARFAGPQQLELKPPSQRELIRRRGYAERARRKGLMEQAFELNAKGRSLRQIARALGVSHQTIANWLAAST
jgi:HNH endonuclease/helix-turn-helix protein